MKSKLKVYNIFQNFHIMVKRQLDFKIMYFQPNFGGEFQALLSYFISHGILPRKSSLHNH